MGQSHALRRKRRKIWSETKTGSYSKLLKDACHAGMQSGGLLLGFDWTTFSKMTLKAFLFVCLFFALALARVYTRGAPLLTTGK